MCVNNNNMCINNIIFLHTEIEILVRELANEIAGIVNRERDLEARLEREPNVAAGEISRLAAAFQNAERNVAALEYSPRARLGFNQLR